MPARTPPAAMSFASTRQQSLQRAPQDSTEEASGSRRKKLLRNTGLYGGAAALAVSSLVLSSISTTIATAHEDALYEQAQPVSDAQSRIDFAADGAAFLPDSDQARRWISQANDIGRNLAQMQNVYLEQTGPQRWQDVPAIDDEMRITTSNPEPRTRAEREEVAAEERASALEGIQQRLHTGFDRESRNSDGFNAASRWDEEVPAVDDQDGVVSLEDYSWVYSDANLYTQHGEVQAVWLLRNPAGENIAWVEGTYNPQSRVFEDLSLGTFGDEVDLG